MNRRMKAGALAVITFAACTAPQTSAQASTNFDLRKKVINLSGIMSVNDLHSYVTRGEFAEMLVKASEYKNTVGSKSSVSVFSDVKKDHEYAQYVRVAVQNQWMSGYLGGVFRPDQYITLQEAAKGALALLGYTNEDFQGDQTGGRMAKFEYLDLKDEIGLSSDEPMTKTDCINMFYNLLRAEPKSGSGIYGTVLGCELTSDGEINPLAMADVTLQGPKLISHSRSLSSAVPFSLDDAQGYLNGSPYSGRDLERISGSEYMVIYYNSSSKTIWAYTPNDSDESDRCVDRGEITHIYYMASDVMTPTAIELDDEVTYQLDSSEMQFAFSIYGTVEVGDIVTLIYTKSGGTSKDSDDDDVTRTVLDYIFED